jgi:hypothetical protein
MQSTLQNQSFEIGLPQWSRIALVVFLTPPRVLILSEYYRVNSFFKLLILQNIFYMLSML